MTHKTALIIPDCHIPFEDKIAYETMLKIASDIGNIASIHILGDYFDFYGLSRYEKDPDLGDVADLYLEEVLQGNARLDELSDLHPGVIIDFNEGNHEIRLKHYILENAPALRKSVTFESQFNFHKRKNMRFHPFTSRQGTRVMTTDCYTRHCPFSSGTPYANAVKAGDSFIYGHTHQLAFASFRTKLSGKEITAINGGWLGDEKAKVFEYVKTIPDWTKAFILVHELNGAWGFEAVRIGQNTTKFHGKFY